MILQEKHIVDDDTEQLVIQFKSAKSLEDSMCSTRIIKKTYQAVKYWPAHSVHSDTSELGSTQYVFCPASSQNSSVRLSSRATWKKMSQTSNQSRLLQLAVFRFFRDWWFKQGFLVGIEC